ncbi:MAG TPA: hypothetical protein VFK89_05420 [Actinomycetota bacterium]|nr:hypothetical protein [Actinomycetota bacterium]
MRVEARSVVNGAISVFVATALAATIAIVGQTGGAVEARAAGAHAPTRSRAAVAFRNDMRKLWEDHITWTRVFIISDVAGLPDRDTAAGRLLANQDDIGDAIRPFYGDAAGDQLTSLLRDHILIAAEILDAAKQGDQAGVADANARWHANGQEIADFLHSANPSQWSRKMLRSMMNEHLDWTLNEAVARLNQDWDADVAAYDHIHQDILHMADTLSLGVIRQFPARF